MLYSKKNLHLNRKHYRLKSKCYNKIKASFLSFLLSIILISSLSPSLAVSAVNYTEEELEQMAEERRNLPIQTNEIHSWPMGPVVSAKSAILMEAETGTILYAKNIHEKLYPASTTKLLTCLLAAENCSLDEMVTFSYDAVHSIPSDGSNMGIDAGEVLPMDECLYGIMVASANEVSSAVAEHVAGDIDSFTDMMNERAKELGCLNSHFVNSNGLYDDNHYTSAYDLALIAKAFFNNDTLRRIGNTTTYHFIPTETQPDDFYKTNKHKLINGEIPYEGIIGGKTGYTSEARQTLVTGCEQNGMRLICVVMMEEAPSQFEDTVTLFDYGYQNFSKVNVAENDSRYIIGDSNFFHAANDIFGNSSSILSINKNSYIILPNMSRFDNLTSTIDFKADGLGENEIAKITYSYEGIEVGDATLLLQKNNLGSYEFDKDNTNMMASSDNIIFVNIKLVILIVSLVAVICILILIIHSIFYKRNDLRHERKRRKRIKRDIRIRKAEQKRSRRFEKRRSKISRRRK